MFQVAAKSQLSIMFLLERWFFENISSSAYVYYISVVFTCFVHYSLQYNQETTFPLGLSPKTLNIVRVKAISSLVPSMSFGS